MLAPLLMREVRSAAGAGRPLPADVVDVALACAAVERDAARRSVAVPSVASAGSTPSRSGHLPEGDEGEGARMGAARVARRAGVSRRAVVKAAAAGRLAGSPGPTGWQFTDAAVTAWIKWREARVAAVAEKKRTAAEADGLAEARSRVAELDGELSALDRRQSALEERRDAAAGLLAALRDGALPGDPVEQWRTGETLAATERELAVLLEERRPVAAERRRVAAVVGPHDARDLEIARLRRQIPLMERAGRLAARMGEVAAEAEELAAEFRSAGRPFPARLARLRTDWRRDPRGVEFSGPGHFSVASNLPVESERARLARLEAGAWV